MHYHMISIIQPPNVFFTQNWVTGYASLSSDFFPTKLVLIVFMLQTNCVYGAAWDFIDSSSYHC